jgi:UDP-N-acetylmuramoyl-tripeptide--D-alanyl-D-alanine ligase
MKTILKKMLAGVLGWQVKRLRRKNNFKIIGVVGSIGKTSTKLAIAKVLASEKRVRWQEGNYNDIVSVPLVFFGREMPQVWNVCAWLWMIIKNEFQIRFREYLFDIVVVELGTDAPGQIAEFRKYLHLDVAVLTAIAPEHMEFFKNIEAEADEEWSVIYFSDLVFVNRDLCKILPSDFDHNQISFYGGEKDQQYEYNAFSKAQIYSANAAIAVADFFKIPQEKIKMAVGEIQSFAGRMQKLRGIKNSIIIDDTYNASPEAMKMALDTLYNFEAPQRIAILGMMNELGNISEEEHKKIGKNCDPMHLDLVVTLGKDANLFLAPVARERGCEVYEAKDSPDAGNFVKEKIRDGAVILAKGSQNGVFAEEALKPILANKADFTKLVRQDKNWMKKKGFPQVDF